MKKKNKKICLFSDSHGLHKDVVIPACDILIFAGDFDIHSSLDLERANRWFGQQNAKHVIFCAGNHDTFLEGIGKENVKKLFTNVIYLENDLVEIEGLRIYGSPFSPEFNNWSFSYQRRSLEAKNIWSKMSYDLDILVSHCPSYGILDRNLQDERCGCEILQREIAIKQPRVHVFGHIHGEYGCINQCGIDFYNVSVLNEDYKIANKPTIIDI